MVLGVSLTNLALGDQSPRESQLRYLSSTTPDGVENYRITSEPLFALPPVPSVLLRVMF